MGGALGRRARAGSEGGDEELVLLLSRGEAGLACLDWLGDGRVQGSERVTNTRGLSVWARMEVGGGEDKELKAAAEAPAAEVATKAARQAPGVF